MIIRIVKMTFQPDKVNEFLELFHYSQPRIHAMPGCQHVELWRQVSKGNILFTYSFWSSQDDLEHYRQSDLFRETWGKSKVLFAAKAEAWSVEKVQVE